MNDLVDAFWAMVNLLERLKVPYAVMGGIAIRALGIPRPTYDVDFAIILDRNQFDLLFAGAEEAGFTVEEPYRTGWCDSVAEMPMLKIHADWGERRIDVDVFLAETEHLQKLMERRVTLDVLGRPVDFATPEDLILLKVLANRPRDLADIADVVFMQGQLDDAYLRHWAERLGVLDRLDKALAQPPNYGDGP